MPESISEAGLVDGIRRTLDNAEDLLATAEVLTRAGRGSASAFFLYHGVEELGKAQMLQEALRGNRTVAADRRDAVFDHRKKYTAAMALIPGALVVVRKGGFDSAAFDVGAFDATDTFVTPRNREDALYVTWQDGRWTEPLAVDPAVVANTVRSVRSVIVEKRKEWLGP